MQTDERFGELIDVPIRQAWTKEAKDFTPWLATNLDRLSKAVGIPMELAGIEQPVGRYSADILALDPVSGERIIIENQLEWSDHRHLGQIMTYLAGTEAKVIIWIAKDFQIEHLAAVKWLNRHSEDAFSFFAIRIRIVQIAASPLAPLFEVVEKPENWDRVLEKQEQTSSLAEPGWQQQFWQSYEARYPDSAQDKKAGGRGASRWRDVGDTNVKIARWVSNNGVGVFVRGDRGTHNSDVLTSLEDHQNELERNLGVPVNAGGYLFLKKFECDPRSEADREKAIGWLETETNNYRDVLRSALGQTEEIA
ncbi:hypothetical protein [Sphingobium yanoikuyae]|uniref:hypothetical protein n=1 Tax=Sphingobium yanoikuyae TaxID=13690 RepID=UPI00345EEDDE